MLKASPSIIEAMEKDIKSSLYQQLCVSECNCNPAGAKDIPGYPLGGCGSVNKGILCECKDRVTGRICDTCKEGYFNLNANNIDGCEDCDCFRPGTIGGWSELDKCSVQFFIFKYDG